MSAHINSLLTSGRLQKSDFTLLHSTYGSSVSDADVMSSFSIVTQDISPNTSRISAYSNHSSTQNVKRRRSRHGRFSKRKAATNLLEDASARDPLTLEAIASLPSNWLNLSFPDRTPTHTDYFVNYWRHAVAKEQDHLVDHFTAVIAAVHEVLQATSAVRSTQPALVQGKQEPSGCIQHENDLLVVSCPWDGDDCTLDDCVEWDEWRREDDEVHVPTVGQHNYGTIGQPPVYPLRNMGTHFQIVAPKPVSAWNNITWLVHSPVDPEPVICHEMEVFVEPESPVVANDLPLYHLPDFSPAAIYAASQTSRLESTAIYSSTSTAYHAYAESTTIYDSSSASPSSYLSAITACMPPAGGCIPPLRANDPHPVIHKTKTTRLERQGSREHNLFRFLRVRPLSYLASAIDDRGTDWFCADVL
ncbi:hypothetical protein EDB19DRAFT_1678978 [Suillus lakei]|nr:hypothetical protein EDB19DRAFT_1678978 [Suillus lakei]